LLSGKAMPYRKYGTLSLTLYTMAIYGYNPCGSLR